MGLAFCNVSRCKNTYPEVTHLNISQRAVNQSPQLENTRNLWKKLTESEKKLLKYENNHFNIENWETLKVFWKKLIKPEKKLAKYYKNASNTEKWVIDSTILKGVERLHPQPGTPTIIENHEIGPHSWKIVKNYEKIKAILLELRSYSCCLSVLV